MKNNSNKQIVIDFYKKAIGEKDLEYASGIVTEDYIQHNPHVKTGKKGFLEAIAFLKKIPQPKNTPAPTMRIIVDKEFVAVHMAITLGGQKKIVLDLFRLENGLIAEHWDAIQVESDSTLNGNSEIEGPIAILDERNTTKNKQLVVDYTKYILIDKAFEKLASFVHQDVIQHNPKIKNGRNAIRDYLRKVTLLKVHKVIGQGNFVMTQSEAIKDGKDLVQYDIYRLDKGLIVEHWSVVQEIPKVMAHTNGMI